MKDLPAQIPNYCIQDELPGHTGPIVALNVRKDAAVAGAPTVWDLQTKLQIPVVSPDADIRGITTTFLWIKRDDNVNEALIYGTQLGYIVCCLLETEFKELWNRQMPSVPAEVTGLAFDPPTNRLAMCHRGGRVQLSTLNRVMAETNPVDLQVAHCVPRAVEFGSMHGDERELLVFGLYCGLVYKVHGTKICTSDRAWSLGCRITDVALDVADNIFAVSDPYSGVNVYSLVPGAGWDMQVKLHVPSQKSRRIQQMGFLEGNQVVVSGSDHGKLFIYTRRDQFLTTVDTGSDEWVQTITTAEVAGVPTIFAAKSSEISGRNNILVIQKRPAVPKVLVKVVMVLRSVVYVVVILAAVAYGYEKIFGEWSFGFALGSRM
ncbi:unnamed protein product [Mycena citricolor]|uniref:Uncharacterized protein n=1 Tax=Mycena citricolor TaxID=2018698 RepID=A0AAD2HB15_9AGAR|nr:unnamed protein product [Mycena citricolor]